MDFELWRHCPHVERRMYHQKVSKWSAATLQWCSPQCRGAVYRAGVWPNSTWRWPNSTWVWPNSTWVWPNSTWVWPNSTWVWPNSTWAWPNSTWVWPSSAWVWPNSAGVWPNSIHVGVQPGRMQTRIQTSGKVEQWNGRGHHLSRSSANWSKCPRKFSYLSRQETPVLQTDKDENLTLNLQRMKPKNETRD